MPSRGAEVASPALGEARIGTVNFAEVVATLIEIGVPSPEGWSASLVPSIVDLGPELANATAQPRMKARPRGLSLGGRACLALAERLRQPVLTTDRAWAGLAVGAEIRLIR
jgi:ribonuclease VapC